MLESAVSSRIKTIICGPDFTLGDDVLLSDEPILLRSLVSHWPIVEKAKKSNDEVVEYLTKLYSGVPVVEVQGGAELSGRIGYVDDFSKLNCVSQKKPLQEVFDDILSVAKQPSPPLYYVGTTPIHTLLPKFGDSNFLNLSKKKATAYMWIGNKSCIAGHYDLPDNLACNVVGRRRFTLFPPNQLKNLYVGPLDFTPAGQPISLVDVRAPDYECFPKFREAQDVSLVAELDPGDALFLPSMWWHHVEGLDDLNILVNYWWRQSPGYMSSPADVLDLALLTIRDLPSVQKQAWREILDHYVFNNNDQTAEHIPEEARGSIGNLDDNIARRLRAKIMSRLNR